MTLIVNSNETLTGNAKAFTPSIFLNLDSSFECEINEVGFHNSTGELPGKAHRKRSLKNHLKLFIAVLISLFVHTVVFLLINSSASKSILDENNPAPAIQATLYSFPQKTKIKQQDVEATPEPTLINKDALINGIDTASNFRSSEQPSKPFTAPFKSQIKESVSAPDIKQELPQESSKKQATLPVTKFDSLAKKHLRQLEQIELNKVFKQLSEEYQYEKTHPQLNARERAQSEEEALIKPLNVDVACDSQLVDKTLKTISGLLNGTAVGEGPAGCNRHYEIDSFIDNRVTKKQNN